jgi:hypothetical protein
MSRECGQLKLTATAMGRGWEGRRFDHHRSFLSFEIRIDPTIGATGFSVLTEGPRRRGHHRQ